MKRSRRKRTFPWRTGGLLLASAVVALGFVLNRREATGLRLGIPSAAADPLEGLSGDARQEGVILAQRKRIMGRLRTLEHVSRTARQIRPLVDRGLEQPAVQGDLRSLAAAAGASLGEYKAYFAGKQEADLLLESGGDPNARSVADAIGVAQFLAGTAQRAGLRVDLRRSEALSRRLGEIETSLVWLRRAPEEWAGKGPGGGRWPRGQWLAYRNHQRQAVLAERRRVDERYDPEKAIRVQTRYLVALTRRYGGVDWALQAYHGGEGGVARTVGLFHGARRGALGSRGGGTSALPYAEVYRKVTPTTAPAAFSYLYGRSDDHRYYWWKVRMAERALDLYRRDPVAFEAQWQALRPGLPTDAVYYGEPEPLAFADGPALRAALADSVLVALPPAAARLGVTTDGVAALDPAVAALHKGLRPEAMGALLRVARVYREQGGTEPLKVVTLAQSRAYRNLFQRKYPEKRQPGTPSQPDFHTTGLCFDLRPPGSAWSRKVLEFALSRLYDTLRLSWRVERTGGLRYHVVVNPDYRDEMIAFYRREGR